MNKIVEDLLLLKSLELGESKQTPEIANLRNKIPAKELRQYDSLQKRGKKGVAVVRNGVCTGCHIRVPVAKVNALIVGSSTLTCDNCGCFLYLSPEQQEQFANHRTVTA